MSNNIYIVDQTVITFKESGGTYLWTPKNVANNAGRVAAQADLGATRPQWYRWHFLTKFQTATIGNIVRLYLMRASTAATTYQDGGGAVGVSDAAVASEATVSSTGLLLGPLVVHSAAGANSWSGTVRLTARYVSPLIFNVSGVALTNTAGDHEFRLEPINDQVQ